MAKRKDFSELTRVQIPAALHLMRMGYTYLPRNGKEIAERDPDTNILVSVFKEQFLKFNNYLTEDDFERELANIKLELDQNDLGVLSLNVCKVRKMPFILTGSILKPIPSIWRLKLLVKMVRMNFVLISLFLSMVYLYLISK